MYSPQLNRLKSFRGRKIARPAALMIRALVAGYRFSKFRVVIRVLNFLLIYKINPRNCSCEGSESKSSNHFGTLWNTLGGGGWGGRSIGGFYCVTVKFT